jgi:hypothetical protein
MMVWCGITSGEQHCLDATYSNTWANHTHMLRLQRLQYPSAT